MRPARTDEQGKVKNAPFVPLDFAMRLEELSANGLFPFGMRIFAAMFTIANMESLRFSDLRDVSEFWITETAAR